MKRVLQKVLKWIGYTFLTLIILTFTSILFLLTSTQTLQWAADRYAPKYGFAYKQISGALLTGLEVEELTFKNERLLDSLKVGWNPASILYNKVSITHLEASGLNVENIKKVVKAFVPTEPEEDNSSFILPFTIGVGEVKLEVDPFEWSGIGFKDISLDVKDIVYYGEGVDIDDLSLSIDTNVTTIELSGEIQEKNVRVKKLNILDIDTIAFQDVIEQMIDIKIHEEIVELVEPEVEHYKAGRKHLLPKSVQVDSAIVTVKPADHPQVKLHQGELNASSIKVDIYGIIDLKPDTVQVGALSVLLDTNLSRLSMQSKLQDEKITVESLSLRELDTIALTKLFESIENNQSAKAETPDINITASPLLPKLLYVKQLDSSIKSATYDPVFVKSAEVNATNVMLNIATLTAESGEIDISAVTNFATLMQHGVIKDNQIEGEILLDNLHKIEGLDNNYSRLLNDLKIKYKGDAKSIEAEIRSNIATIEADVLYDKELKVVTKTTFPKDSLLRAYIPKLNFDALSPLHADILWTKKVVHADVKSKGLTSKMTFNPKNKDLDGDLVMGGAKFLFKGNVEKKISLEKSVGSVQSLLNKISTIYTFKPPPLDGDLKVSLALKEMKDLELNLRSNRLIYKTDRKTEHILNNIMISLGFSDSVLTLNKYHTTFQEQKIFANKPSVINIKEGKLEISPLWINDELKVTGKYNSKDKKGEILAYADSLNVSHEKTSLRSRVDIKSTVNDKRISLRGSFTILGGNINYDMDTKKFDHDRDIVMIKEKKKSQKNPFYDLLETELKIDTQKALLYKNKDANIKATADLLITKKSKGPLKMHGELNILAGSSYTFKGHTFVLKESHIHFVGNPKQPSLDIAAIYQNPRAQITVQITGSPASPHFIFSSTPYMNRQEILSMLLFDSLDEGDYHSEEEMEKLMGSSIKNSQFSNVGDTVAKSIFSSIGMNIDHIPFIGSSHQAKRNQRTLTSLVLFENEDKIKR
ncbi:MAG: translocation/assembly module TamB domain-containing protein, partial [Sulfurovum sp.]|nr:translocation/assembly module TamB domain-containing protein [Sulfurovum sp.]